jgi:hypothetical protein
MANLTMWLEHAGVVAVFALREPHARADDPRTSEPFLEIE